MSRAGAVAFFDVTKLELDPAKRPLGAIAGRPLVPVAIALIVGIAISGKMPLLAPLWIAATFSLAIIAALVRRHPRIATTAISLACATFGIAIAQLSASYYPAHHIAHFSTETRRLAQLELRLVHPPRIYAPTFGQAYPMPPKQVALAEVTAVRTWQGWQQSTGAALIQIAEPNPMLKVGQTVRAFGLLDRPAPAMNPGQFDWATYYRQQRVLVSFHVPRAGNIVIADEGRPTVLQRWRAWTRDMLAGGFADRQSLDHALLRALVLGDSDPELRDVQEQFRATGTSHHLAISGMHIAVMGGVIFLIARVVRLSPRWSWAIAMAFVTAYGLAALPSPPVVRSVLLWLAIGMAMLGRRGVDPLQLLALVVITMLLYHPLDLFNAGFQLSFGIVLGLILLTRPLAWLLGQRPAGEEEEVVPTRWVLRAAAYVDSQILLAIAAGVVAWLVSMPIIASHFTQLNPWAVMASIAIAPAVFVTLIAGVFKIVLTAIWPGMATGWAWGAQLPTQLMRWSVDMLAQLPYGDVPLPAPTWWMIGLFYVTLLLAARRWPAPGLRLLTRLAHLAAIGVLLFLPYRSTITHSTPRDAVRVTILSVGAGQCAVVEPPSGRVTIIDAGSLSLADPVRRAIAPFLRARGITQVDTIAVSHANSDHFSAVAELVEAYGVRQVLVGPGFAEMATNNPMLSDLLADLRRVQRPPTTIRPGQIIPLGADTTLEALWPVESVDFQPNDRSLVLTITHAGKTILFPGDIQDAAMRSLLQGDPDALRADLLIAPHHGSAESATADFLTAVRPGVIVSSNDRTLSNKQKQFETIAGAIPLYRTHTSGAVTIVIDHEGNLSVTPFVGAK